MPDVRFEPYEGLAGLERLWPEWLALLGTMPEPRFNHYPGWYRAYLVSLAPPDSRIWFVALRRNGTLSAILPLQFRYLRFGPLRVRIVGTIEDFQMQLSDFIFARCAANAQLLDEATRWLRSQRVLRWSGMRLSKVADDSCLAYSARCLLPPGTLVQPCARSQYLRSDVPYEQAMQAVSAKFRSNLRRRNRIAESAAPLRLAGYRRADELKDAFQTFLEIEASGWKGEAGTSSAIRCQPALLAFYEALLQEFGRTGACVINLLWHGDRPIAGQLCLHIGRTLNILKVGFSEQHAQFAPGLLLLDKVIRQACQDPHTDVVHLVNNPSWARFFRPCAHGVWSYCVPAYSAGGLLMHLGFWVWRKWTQASSATEIEAAGGQPSDRQRVRGSSLQA